MLCAVMGENGKVPKWAEMVEIRADLFPNFVEVQALHQRLNVPFIATWRGGSQQQHERLLALKPDYIDLDVELNFEVTGPKIIRSYHDYKKTPLDLEQVLQKLQKNPAHLYKIATRANSTLDALRMLLLVRKTGCIGTCIGPDGAITRILGPVMGSPVTYGDAPGEITGEELVNTYHFPQLNRATHLYGLIGDPVSQSVSHRTHNEILRKKGLNAVYVKMRVEKGELEPFLELAKKVGFRGLSVTMPLKNPWNTLKLGEKGYEGISTDGIGALEAIGKPLKGKRVVLIGAGGAARSIAESVVQAGALLTILNRTEAKANRLAQEVGAHAAPLAQFESIAHVGYDFLIQATSCGMLEESCPVPKEHLLPHTHLLEVVSVPKETPLVKAAIEKECSITYGLEMFHAQARAQFDWWLG